jgi:hypothetical protein
MVSFIASKFELLKAFDAIRKAIPAHRRKKAHCECTVLKDGLLLRTPGADVFVTCKTESSARFIVNFLYFRDIIASYKFQEIEVKILPDKLNIGLLTISANTCFFENDSILRTVELPLNFTPVDLLRAGKNTKYTHEELKFSQLRELITAEEKLLEQNIDIAFGKLKKYGVSKAEIEKIVMEKIYIEE